LETIGYGSEAIVYRCEDQNAVQYALKAFYYSRFLPSELSQRADKFLKEARLLKYLNQRSRHFIDLIDYEYKHNEKTGYMILELADGSLREHMQGVPLDEEFRKFYWKQMVTILKELQDARVGN
jgi:serine/threonine protein kinase